MYIYIIEIYMSLGGTKLGTYLYYFKNYDIKNNFQKKNLCEGK
jgi:hypothetical protein